MPLAIRVYECAKCGFVIGRDHNSAISIDRAPTSPNIRPLRRRGSASKKREREGRTQSEPPQRCRLSATAANAKPNE
jgi:transposase